MKFQNERKKTIPFAMATKKNKISRNKLKGCEGPTHWKLHSLFKAIKTYRRSAKIFCVHGVEEST